MNLNPLLLPEILSKVLDYVDRKTLKSSRLVSSLWNEEAGKILSSFYWVKLNEYDAKSKRLSDLQHTLATSPNPALFFGKLKLNEYNFPRVNLFNLLKKYGKYLNTLYLDHEDSDNWYEKDGPAFCQRLIHRVLTESSPFLQELNLSFQFRACRLTPPISYLELRGPTNLRIIGIHIYENSEISVEFQDFLVQIVAASPKLKALTIVRQTLNGENDHLYQTLFALQHMMNKLEKFAWKGHIIPINKTDIVPNIHFLSNRLKTLGIESANVDPKSFHLMINTIGSSLKNLELMDCGFDRDNHKEFQSHLLEIVINSLGNLETLRIGYRHCSPDHLFSDAESLNAPPHQNLRRLFFPWFFVRNVLDVRSVSNVVKWFPNLTLLSLCFGEYERHKSTMGECIRLQEAVGILSGLKRLKDLNLRLCSNTVPGDLQRAFKALLHIPSLLCCTFVELKKSMVGKTTYGLEDSGDELKELKHLNFIRLMGFKIKGKKAIQNFAKENGLKFEFYDAPEVYSYPLWEWSPTFLPMYDDE